VKVAICHQGFAGGDAIGNDMSGMYRLLDQLGIEPTIVCEWSSQAGGFCISQPSEAEWDSFELIIYHHSLYWGYGEELIHEANRPIVFKYHNITPSHFFEPYSLRYAEVCRLGREQIVRLVAEKPCVWLADSSYNRDELIACGADPAKVFVVPPFNRIGELLQTRSVANYEATPVEILFLGRFAPNKGHDHLLKIAKAFVSEIDTGLLIRMVGPIDSQLERYRREIVAMIASLGLQKHVQICEHCSDDEALRLFQHSHVYLTCSEHEGFCVPVIEAQAIGLPVVAANVCAVGETAGDKQLLPRLPTNKIDYSFYAGLINELIRNQKLRDQVVSAGYKNARERFTNEPLENIFVGAISDLIHTK
jgi:glycosyltransferase involved in cell wall biosynthesis